MRMKRLVFIFTAFCFAFVAGALAVPAAVGAADVTLAWDAPAGTGAETWSTRIYIGTAAGDYTATHEAGNPERVDGVQRTVIGDLVPGESYYFAATHLDVDGNESGYSNEVTYDVPPGPPGALGPLPELPAVQKYELTIRRLE